MAHEGRPQVNGSAYVVVDTTPVQNMHTITPFLDVCGGSPHGHVSSLCLTQLWCTCGSRQFVHSLLKAVLHTYYILTPSSISLESNVYIYIVQIQGLRHWLLETIAAQLACSDLGDRRYFKNAFPFHHTPVHALDLSKTFWNSSVL